MRWITTRIATPNAVGLISRLDFFLLGANFNHAQHFTHAAGGYDHCSTYPIKSSTKLTVTTSTASAQLDLFINRAHSTIQTQQRHSISVCDLRVGSFTGFLQHASEQDGLGSFHSNTDSSTPGSSQPSCQRHIQGISSSGIPKSVLTAIRLVTQIYRCSR
jgi:hypothetical protein